MAVTKKGDRLRFREIVMGLDYDVTGTIVESHQDKDSFKFVFQSEKKTAFITFAGHRTERLFENFRGLNFRGQFRGRVNFITLGD